LPICFGVLGAQPAVEAERLPIGPYALCRIVRDCGEQMPLNLETQLQLYQVFERQVMERHTELIDRANILLAREGVLPGLVYRPYLVRPSAPRGSGQTAPPGATPPHASRAGAAAGNKPLTSWQGQMPAASWTQLPGMAADTAASGFAPPPPSPTATATGPAPA